MVPSESNPEEKARVWVLLMSNVFPGKEREAPQWPQKRILPGVSE
jgi:hypothetical protein